MPNINFIEEYLKLTEDLESPTSYLKWGAISCLSAVLRDNVYFKFPNRLETVYANIYVLLIGETAKVRKSNPMNITRDLLRNTANTKCMAGAASMQGVLKELANTETGKPSGGSGIMIAKELDAFFVKDPATIGILTDLYDYHPTYEKYLASYDIPPIKNVCLSLLAGSNEVMMRSLFDQTAIEGGLLGRCIVIKEDNKRKSNSGFEEDVIPVKDEDWNILKTFLKILSTVKGPLTFTLEARRYYNEWYHSLFDRQYDTKTGFEYRIHTHVIKLAAILSASKSGFDKVIELKEVEEAIDECGKLIKTYKKLTLGVGMSDIASTMSLIIKTLLDANNYHLSRRELLVKLYGEIDVEMLDRAMTTLVATEFVEEASINMNPGYRCTGKLLTKMLENRKARGMVQ